MTEAQLPQQPITVVSSCSQKGWARYGERFVDTFLKRWPEHISLRFFTEGYAIPEHHRVQQIDLADDIDHEVFCDVFSGPEFNHPIDYSMQSVRFCHKVFAITSPLLPEDGWRVWIDADVVTHSPVTAEWLRAVLPDNKAVSYLGRIGMMRPGQAMHSECGWVGYNLTFPRAARMLREMRMIYITGELFKLGQFNWHDSYVFDHCLRAERMSPQHVHNLGGHIRRHCLNIWDESLLQQTMTHNKGLGRKEAAYGPER